MYKALKGLLIIILLIAVAGCGASIKEHETENTSVAQKNYEEMINSAEEIKIVESAFSFTKAYTVEINGESAATVSGKLINMFGDEFTLTDSNGAILATEKEIKRWNNFSINRLAEVKNPEDKIIGYIGEDVLQDFFKIGYLFHFYNSDKQEIGLSDQINFSFTKENKFYDKNKNVDYEVIKEFISFTDEYTLKIYDKSDIPLYTAILMVCIEDAIYDADKEKEVSK